MLAVYRSFLVCNEISTGSHGQKSVLFSWIIFSVRAAGWGGVLFVISELKMAFTRWSFSSHDSTASCGAR